MNLVSFSIRAALLLFVGATSCAPGRQAPAAEEAPLTRPLGFDGQFRLDDKTGALLFLLDEATCEDAREVPTADGRVVQVDGNCPAFAPNLWSEARLTTPWGQTIATAHVGPTWIAFQIDWKQAGIDPLRAADADKLNRGWRLVLASGGESLDWRPTAQDRLRMLARIGEATDTQVGVQEVSAPPSLVVKSFRVDHTLRNGQAAQLILEVANEGQGAAYRLYATTRSNVPALHGLQFSFGRLQPGQAKTRTLKVQVPRDNKEAEAAIVLNFREAHQHTPARASEHFTVLPAVDMPVLRLACHVKGGEPGERSPVDAGQTVEVSCEVGNQGAAAKTVKLVARLVGGGSPLTGEPFVLGENRTHVVLVPVEVPQTAAIDSELVVEVVARDASSGASREVKLQLVVQRPRLCQSGKLSRADYKKKEVELKKALEQGIISKEEYHRYVDELVDCLGE